MPDRLSSYYVELLKKKQNFLKDVSKALSLQNEALENRDAEKIVLYSKYIESKKDEIRSVDRVISGLRSEITPEIMEDYSLLEEEISRLKENVLWLFGSNISLLKTTIKEIGRQIHSVKLLNKRNSLYNPVSRSERIDITL